MQWRVKSGSHNFDFAITQRSSVIDQLWRGRNEDDSFLEKKSLVSPCRLEDTKCLNKLNSCGKNYNSVNADTTILLSICSLLPMIWEHLELSYVGRNSRQSIWFMPVSSTVPHSMGMMQDYLSDSKANLENVGIVIISMVWKPGLQGRGAMSLVWTGGFPVLFVYCWCSLLTPYPLMSGGILCSVIRYLCCPCYT